jgi:hypothetical protein
VYVSNTEFDSDADFTMPPAKVAKEETIAKIIPLFREQDKTPVAPEFERRSNGKTEKT